MIIKRLLRFSLGPSYLQELDEEHEELEERSAASIKKLVEYNQKRYSSMHAAQIYILKSLGLISNKDFMSQSSFLLKRNFGFNPLVHFYGSNDSVEIQNQGFSNGPYEENQNEDSVILKRDDSFSVLTVSTSFMTYITGSILYDLRRRIQVSIFRSRDLLIRLNLLTVNNIRLLDIHITLIGTFFTQQLFVNRSRSWFSQFFHLLYMITMTL